MSTEKYEVRAAVVDDFKYLCDLDLKCYEFPWAPELWARVLNNHIHSDGFTINVYTSGDRPIGFSVCHDSDRNEQSLFVEYELRKIGVHPSYRGYRIGEALLQRAFLDARNNDQTLIFTIVPEPLVYPDVEDSPTMWLVKNGFKARAPFVKEFDDFYGELVDGVIFEKQLVGTPAWTNN